MGGGGGGRFIHLFVPSSSCGFVVVSIYFLVWHCYGARAAAYFSQKWSKPSQQRCCCSAWRKWWHRILSQVCSWGGYSAVECWTFPSEDWCEVTPVVVNRVFAGYSKISCSRCEWPNFGSSFFQQGAGYVLHRWSEVLSRGEVAVIHRKKNYLLYKDATSHNLWPCDFTDVTAFSSVFFLALHYCFFLYIFGLLWLFLWL